VSHSFIETYQPAHRGLADVNDRGKLNIAEFHVAMGLIYRRLSGNPIPDTLPAELVPPSARDLDDSVRLITEILKNDATSISRSRSPGNLDEGRVSSMRNRSLYGENQDAGTGRDATIYRHSDVSEPPGGFYQSTSRHIDRKSVRSRNDSNNPASDLEELKSMVNNTSSMFESAIASDQRKTAEDVALEREMADLRFKVKSIQEDLEYNSRAPGPRTEKRDRERRDLEREIMSIMHEKLPDLEKRIKNREEEREREERRWGRERDKRNERFGRSSAYEDRDRYERDRYEERDRDRPYSRGYEDSERDRYNDRDRRDRYDGRDRDRDRERESYRRTPSPSRGRYSPTANQSRNFDTRSPVSPVSQPAPPPSNDPPKPAPSPGPNFRSMSAAEKQAYARAEAQRRIDARKAALGIVSPPSTTPTPGAASIETTDGSVEERLAQDKREAEEKARLAEKEQQERERERKERLERERAASQPQPPKPAAPTPKAAPPPPKGRNAPAPPPPRGVLKQPAAPPSIKPSLVERPKAIQQEEDKEDDEEAEFRRREEALLKQREARLARQKQAEEENRQREKNLQKEKEREERRRRLEEMEREEREADAAFDSAATSPQNPGIGTLVF
jgi:actin cytoskeleton-regulatory complex protein PAN1